MVKLPNNWPDIGAKQLAIEDETVLYSVVFTAEEDDRLFRGINLTIYYRRMPQCISENGRRGKWPGNITSFFSHPSVDKFVGRVRQHLYRFTSVTNGCWIILNVYKTSLLEERETEREREAMNDQKICCHGCRRRALTPLWRELTPLWTYQNWKMRPFWCYTSSWWV